MTMPVTIRVLPGEPKDGTGRVRIHFFVGDPNGPAKMPEGRFTGMPNHTPAGYLACQPKQAQVTPKAMIGYIEVTIRSDDPRAANCPECLATQQYKDAMKKLEELITN